MTGIIALFARWGLGERAARLAVIIGAAIAAWALLAALVGIWLHFHDRAVINRHEAKVSSAVSIATSAADFVADANDQLRGFARVASDQDLRKAIEHAETTEPDRARGAAGPAVNAVAERLRQHGTDRHAGP